MSDCLWFLMEGTLELSTSMEASETLRLYGQPDVHRSRRMVVQKLCLSAGDVFGQVVMCQGVTV